MPSKIKPLRVLSIDFDFFQDVDVETVMSYPDGHDLSTSLSVMVWANHYAYERDNERLRKVHTNETRLKEIKQILLDNAEDDKPVLITQSHVHIYDFILEHYKANHCNALDLVNIDMHHDMFNNNQELDCGNWVSHIARKIPKHNIKWIANPISKEVYGLKGNLISMVETDFESIKDKTFDIIFLCRSDVWTPPHLDNAFADLYDHILSCYGHVFVDKQITKPREFETYAAQIQQSLEEYLNSEKRTATRKETSHE